MVVCTKRVPAFGTKHVKQLLEENHLRWDSLGEFLALAVSLEDLGIKNDNARAITLAKALDEATGKLLETNKSPSRKTGELITAAAISTRDVLGTGSGRNRTKTPN